MTGRNRERTRASQVRARSSLPEQTTSFSCIIILHLIYDFLGFRTKAPVARLTARSSNKKQARRKQQ